MKRNDMCTEMKRVPPGQIAGSGNEVKEKEEKRSKNIQSNGGQRQHPIPADHFVS
jgi:hypothetical protein